MDILINNPISLMYGPYFLFFYGVIITVTIMGCYLILRGNLFNSTIAEIPSQPDPYEIAYLRDGEKAVAKLACLELVQKGFLQANNNSIVRSLENADLSSLKPIEKTIFDWVYQPRTASDFNYDYTFNSAIAQHCESYKQYLETAGYFHSVAKNYLVGGVSAFIILGLGSYKLISALSRGHHNVLFLIEMAIAATIIVASISLPLYNRVTANGKRYLDNLKQTFSGLTGSLQSPPTEPDYNTSLLVAIFGLDKLKASSNYQDFVNLFIPSTSRVTYSSSKTRRNYDSTDSNSGFSSCSTSSCSSSCGSSCGGGCGGCGGCGG
jgi:uncharacterized protein (TIGR04222 family)